jgi:hypothetical protein
VWKSEENAAKASLQKVADAILCCGASHLFRMQNRVDECGRSNASWALNHGILFFGALKPFQLNHISLSVSRCVLVRHTHRTNTFISGSAQLAGR